MKIKKLYKCITALIICSFLAFPVSQVHAQDRTVNVSISVGHEFILQDTGYNHVDTTGVYVLESKTKDSPMPNKSTEQKYKFELDGKKADTNLTMEYTHGGVYEYKLYPRNEKRENYTYDTSEYDITVYVKNSEDGKLIPQIVAKNEQGEKSMAVVFRNNCAIKQIDNSELPKTGDTAYLGILILTIVCSGGILLGLNLKRHKNNGKSKE